VRHLTDALARRVWPLKRLEAESNSKQGGPVSKVENLRDAHLSCHESARSNKLATHPFNTVDKVAIGLNDDRIRRSPQIQDRECSRRTPMPARIASLQRRPSNGCMAVEDAG
jgi:hypothetical protein